MMTMRRTATVSGRWIETKKSLGHLVSVDYSVARYVLTASFFFYFLFFIFYFLSC